MKIALYIEDGLEQIVLTPESDHEHKLLGYLHDDSRTLSIKRGKFYECRGGWLRQGQLGSQGIYGFGRDERDGDESTMLVLRPAQVGRNPEGEDRNGLRAEHEHAVPEGDAPTPSIQDPPHV